MKLLAIIIIATGILGCTPRMPDKLEGLEATWYICEEPDTEWIMEQYHLYGEVATNDRRIREGW